MKCKHCHRMAWEYRSTTLPSDGFPFPVHNYTCARGCPGFYCVAQITSMVQCPHDAGWALDPLIEGDSPWAMCMRCHWSADEDSNEKLVCAWFKQSEEEEEEDDE